MNKKHGAVLVVAAMFFLLFQVGQVHAMNAIDSLPTCTSASTPSITVTSPGGGQVYQVGQQINVQWSTCNLPTNHTIWVTLHQSPDPSGKNYGDLSQQWSSDTGQSSFTIPSVLANTETTVTSGSYIVDVEASWGSDVTGNSIDGDSVPFTISLSSDNSSLFPAGCSSSVGFSTVNGAACNGSGVNSFPLGCTSTTGFSTVNGLACDGSGVTSFFPGCTSTTGYSITNGAPCSGSSTTVSGCSSASAGFSTTTGAPCSNVYVAPSVSVDSGCSASVNFSTTTGAPCNNPPTPIPTVPAGSGCTAATVYSTTTGAPCNNPVATPECKI